MLKVVLTVILPLLLPTLVYVTYVVLTNRRAVAAGTEGERPGVMVGAPWFWLIASGIGLTAALLVALALFGGQPKDGVYIPAHRGPDGEYVPARTVPRDQAPAELPTPADRQR